MIYQLNGSINASNAFETKEALYGMIDGREDLIIDMSQVDLVDSTGLGVLVSVHKRLQMEDRSLILRHVSGKVRNVMKITMLDQIIGIE